jgi:hypothetical protein
MTNADTARSSKQARHNRFLLILLVLAALASALKDLNVLQGFSGSFQSWTSQWFHAGLTSVKANGMSAAERSCAETLVQTSSDQFRWSGRVAPGQSVEIKGINGSISAEATPGGEIEVAATKKARRSDPADVEIKVVPHAGGVTICAVYKSEYPDEPNTCEPGKGNGRMNVRNNDVRVDFKVRVPAGIGFVGRTVNGEISAVSLSGNIESSTVNGGIDLSTTGYAEAKTVNGEINARLGNANWPDSLAFKTVNGGITIDLPATTSTRVEADTFNGDISSDFPLSMLGRISRKHISGTIGNGGRDLTLKTLNGSIRLRRAG